MDYGFYFPGYYLKKGRKVEVKSDCEVTKIPNTDFYVVVHPALPYDKKSSAQKVLVRRNEGKFEYCQDVKNVKFGKSGVLAVQNLDGTYQFGIKKSRVGANDKVVDSWELSRNQELDSLNFASNLDGETSDEYFIAKKGRQNLVLNEHGTQIFKTNKGEIRRYDQQSRMAIVETGITHKQMVIARNGQMLAKADRVYPCLGGFISYNKSAGDIKFVDKFYKTHVVQEVDKKIKNPRIDIKEVAEGAVQVSVNGSNRFVDCAGRVTENATRSSAELYRFVVGHGEISSISPESFNNPEFATAVVLELKNRSYVDLTQRVDKIRTIAQTAEMQGAKQSRMLAKMLKAIDAAINLHKLRADLKVVENHRKTKNLKENENSEIAKQNIIMIDKILNDPEYAQELIEEYKSIKNIGREPNEKELLKRRRDTNEDWEERLKKEAEEQKEKAWRV